MSSANSRRDLKHKVFMAMAIDLAWLSTCCRRKVGCILIDKRDRIIGLGYNGVPAGEIHCTDVQCPGAFAPSGTALELCEAIHAEANALLVCERPFEIERCYTVASPCLHCIKLLLNTSCVDLYYTVEYPHALAKERWQRAGRFWHKL